jgi:uncharacterized RDD family membrane protein YckC
MKCPKCHYLSFEPEPRCRHCGYDFSLAETPLALELDTPARTAAAEPLVDLPLRNMASAPAPQASPSRIDPPASDSVARQAPVRAARSRASSAVAAPTPPAVEPRARSGDDAPSAARSAGVAMPPTAAAASVPPPLAPVTTELPLFVKAAPTAGTAPTAASKAAAPEPVAPSAHPVAQALPEAPAVAAEPSALSPIVAARVDPSSAATAKPDVSPVAVSASDGPIVVPSAPPPLSVRRRAADASRHRPSSSAASARGFGPFDRDLLEDLERLESGEPRGPAASVPDGAGSTALARIAAGVLDLVLLAALNAAIVLLTLRQTGLAWPDLPTMAVLPLGAFLWLVDAGYLLMFTASGGQTVGKMALGLRVVDASADGGDRITLGQAATRSVLLFPSIFTLGAGFVPALFGEHAAVHDRLTHTRVVRA